MADSDDEESDPKIWIEIWKKTVEVQQHFNDLELRIRNYVIIVLGAILALGGYALRQHVRVSILDKDVSATGVIVFMAVIPLLAFYFMDRWWYHRLLQGAVKAGQKVELKMKDLGYPVDLGVEISKASPIKICGSEIHSKIKLDTFYALLIFAVLVTGYILL